MSRSANKPAIAHAPLATARIKINKGPHKGTVYKLVAGKVTIGRSSENDICLMDDEKCSRKQAVITFGPNGYSIKDTSNRSSLKINNFSQVYSKLQDGDEIQCGNSTLQFEYKLPVTATPALPTIPVIAPAGKEIIQLKNKNGNAHLAPTHLPENNLQEASHRLANSNELSPYHPQHISFPDEMGQKQNTYKQLGKKRKIKPKILLVSGIIFISWLLLSDSDNGSVEEKKDILITRQDKERDIKTLSELKEKEQAKRKINSLPTFKNAQFAYVKGVRDYRKGLYNRAIESFRVCKTLYPKHELCSNYLQKSQIKQQQLIQSWMISGKYHREKREFHACMANFQNVIFAIQDETNIVYKEAFENYKICQIQHEDRY